MTWDSPINICEHEQLSPKVHQCTMILIFDAIMYNMDLLH